MPSEKKVLKKKFSASQFNCKHIKNVINKLTDSMAPRINQIIINCFYEPTQLLER